MKIIQPVKADLRSSMKTIVAQIENQILAQVKGGYPSGWNRDGITAHLLKDIGEDLNGKKVLVPGNSMKISWKLLEAGKSFERYFAHVAILARITYHDGQVLEGVAFFDAVTKDPEKNTFSELKRDHLRRMHSISPHSHLLLYDYDMITGMAFPTIPEYVVGNYPNTWNSWIPYTNAGVIPAHAAIALGIKNTGLYKIAVPFSYHLCYRIFYGLGLDFNNTALETGKGKRAEKGVSRYLVQLSVAHGGAEPQSDFDINREVFSESV